MCSAYSVTRIEIFFPRTSQFPELSTYHSFVNSLRESSVDGRPCPGSYPTESRVLSPAKRASRTLIRIYAASKRCWSTRARPRQDARRSTRARTTANIVENKRCHSCDNIVTRTIIARFRLVIIAHARASCARASCRRASTLATYLGIGFFIPLFFSFLFSLADQSASQYLQRRSVKHTLYTDCERFDFITIVR